VAIADNSGWSISTKVRVALVAVLLLIAPQVALTVYYLVELESTADAVSARTRFVVDMGGLRETVLSIDVPQPLDSNAPSEDRFLDAVTGAMAATQEASDNNPSFKSEIQRISDGLAGLDQATREYVKAIRQAREIAPTRRALAELLSGDPAETGVDLAPLLEGIAITRADLRERFDAATIRAYDQLRSDEVYAKRVVDHADRNLATLTMLTVVFVVMLLVALPGRLVLPIRRLTQVVRQAEKGKLETDVEFGDAEVGALADAFSSLMRQVREFDQRKRNRIIEDAAKLDLLLEQLDGPAALLLAPSLLVERSNRAFRELLGVQVTDTDVPLPDLMAEGGDAMRMVLTRGASLRGRQEPVALEILTGDAKRPMLADVQLCRDQRGRPTHLLLVLRKAPKTLVKAG